MHLIQDQYDPSKKMEMLVKEIIEKELKEIKAYFSGKYIMIDF